MNAPGYYENRIMMHLHMAALALCLLSACANASHKDWDNIDYSGIARANQARENDPNYVPPVPSVMGCSDDDLYNCK